MEKDDEQLIPTQAELFFVYQSLESRRSSYDSMLWQTTAIALTAQSFLLTIALGPNSKSSVRLATAMLSFAISLMAMQLMAKHRWGEMLDSVLLEGLENKLGITKVLGVSPHDRLKGRVISGISEETTKRLSPTWIRNRSSYLIWQLGLSLFGATSLGVILVVVLGHANQIFGHA